jgi:multiple sugar transport system substrate-binding protein
VNQPESDVSPIVFLLVFILIVGMFLMGYSLLEGSNRGSSQSTVIKLSPTKLTLPIGIQKLSPANLSLPLHNQNRKPDLQRPVLRVWVTYNEEQFRVYRKVARKFEESENVILKISKIPWSGQAEFLQYACNSHRAPDIARMDLGLIPKFAAGGALLELDKYNLSSLQKKLLPAAFDACQVRSREGQFKTYALPDEFTTLALYYNRDHFQRAGLDPSRPPETWDEFIRVGQRLTRDIDQDGSLDQFGFAMNVTPWFSMPFLYSFGGKILDDNKLLCLLERPEAVEALKFQISLTSSNVEAGAWRQGAIGPDAGFKSGRYSMIFSGPWNLENFRRSGVNFSVSLIPGNPKLKIKSSTNVGGNANVIFRTSKHPDLAVKFLTYLLSKEVQELFCKELGAIPLHVDVRPPETELQDRELLVFMEQSLYAGSRPKIPGYDRIEDIVNKEVETAFEGHRTAEGAYQQACRKITELILKELE